MRWEIERRTINDTFCLATKVWRWSFLLSGKATFGIALTRFSLRRGGREEGGGRDAAAKENTGAVPIIFCGRVAPRRWSLNELYSGLCGEPIQVAQTWLGRTTNFRTRDERLGSVNGGFLYLTRENKYECLPRSERTRSDGTKNDALAGLGYPGLGPPLLPMHRYSVYRPLPNPAFRSNYNASRRLSLFTGRRGARIISRHDLSGGAVGINFRGISRVWERERVNERTGKKKERTIRVSKR